MREIKFRAWNPNAKEYQGYAGNVHMPLHEAGALASSSIVFELEQYTGLKDKNGVEIYHKDICKYLDDSGAPRVGVVEWQAFQWAIEYIHGDDEGNQDIELHPAYMASTEVIGNIHENPELLTPQS